MPERPRVIVFDVLETLFSLDPVRDRFREQGLPAGAVNLWFAYALRDGFGQSAANDYRPFKDVAESALEVVFAQHGVAPEDEAVQHVMGGLKELTPYPDVAPAMDAAREAGVDVLVCSNGGRESAENLLAKANLDGLVTRAVGVDEVRRWKPAADVYMKAVEEGGADPAHTALVAVHGWDIMGARNAGLTTGYCTRLEKHFPRALGEPDVKADTLDGVVEALLQLPAAREPAAR